MALPNTFASATTINSVEWDQNYAAVSALGFVRCTASGTGTYTLTPSVSAATISGYAEPLYLSCAINATNPGAATLQVNALGFLPVYKGGSGGPVALSGGELLAGNDALFVYDAALNSGAGGFFLVNPFSAATISVFTGSASLTFGALAPAASASGTIAVTGATTACAVAIGLPTSPTAGIVFQPHVAATNSVVVVATNITGSTVTVSGATYTAKAIL